MRTATGAGLMSKYMTGDLHMSLPDGDAMQTVNYAKNTPTAKIAIFAGLVPWKCSVD